MYFHKNSPTNRASKRLSLIQKVLWHLVSSQWGLMGFKGTLKALHYTAITSDVVNAQGI